MCHPPARQLKSLADAGWQVDTVDCPPMREAAELREEDRQQGQALMRLLCQNDGPAAMLNNLEDYNRPDVPIIFNPFGTRERTAMMIDCKDPLEMKKKHAAVLSDPSKLTTFSGGGVPTVKPADDPNGRARENLVHVLINQMIL